MPQSTPARHRPHDSDRVPLLAFAVALGSVHLIAVIVIAAARIAYPFELDWFEGPMLEQTLRVLSGRPIYVAPSVAYVPLVYPPLFNYAAAAMSAVVGPGFAALRAVSALAAAATLLMLGAWVTRETGRRSAGFLAAATYAAGQHLAESWLDIGRSDSLFLSLVFAGAWIYRSRSPGKPAAIAAGAMWALAFLCKQSAPVVLGPLLVWLAAREGARGWYAIVTFATLSATGALALDAASGGWFRYYTFVVPRKFSIDPALAVRFLIEMSPLLPAIALGIAGAWTQLRNGSRGVGFHLTFVLGLVLSSWQLRLYPGAGGNVLLTAVLGVALAAGLGFGWLAARPALSARSRWGIGLAMCVQLALLLHNPLSEMPRSQDRLAGEGLVSRLKQSAGPIYVSSHPYLARRATGRTNVHIAPLMDLVRAPRDSVQDGLWQAMRDSLQGRSWSLLVLDQRDWLLDEAHAAGYREVARVFPDPDAFWPVTGYRTRPEWVMAPEERLNSDAPRDSSPRVPDPGSGDR